MNLTARHARIYARFAKFYSHSLANLRDNVNATIKKLAHFALNLTTRHARIYARFARFYLHSFANLKHNVNTTNKKTCALCVKKNFALNLTARHAKNQFLFISKQYHKSHSTGFVSFSNFFGLAKL